MNTTNPDVDVVIAGLGPTGLVLAHMLGMRGHRVTVLEREPVFYGNARAVYTDDECLRIFQSVDCADQVHKDMIYDVPVQFTRPDGSVLGRYKPLEREFGWPVINFFYQPWLETSLSDLLVRYPNVEVMRGRELVDFQAGPDTVTIEHRATQTCRFGNGDEMQSAPQQGSDLQSISCRYLVGADGGRSRVRECLGIGMTGRNFPENWLVVDLQQKDPSVGLRHLPYFNFVVDPKLPVVSCIQPGGFHRFEFMMMEGQTKEWLEQPETVRMLLSKFVNPDDFEIKRKLVYTFNALMAEKWRDGRVFLAGDAAHMTPQFMGQGASSGIRDAYNLGWKLSAVLRGKASETLLDTYQRERQAHAQDMIDISVMMKNVVSMTNPIVSALRNLVFFMGRHVGPLRKYIEEGGFKPRPVYRKGGYLGLARTKGNGPEGTLVPQPVVRDCHGKSSLLDDQLGSEFAVIGLRVDPRDSLSPRQIDWLVKLGAKFVALYPFGERPQATNGVFRDHPDGLMELEDIEDRMSKWFADAGFGRSGVLVQRPDRFAYAIVAATELGTAVDQLRLDLGVAPGELWQNDRNFLEKSEQRAAQPVRLAKAG